MAVSKRLRYEILRRDNHACRYCGATAPDVKLTVDHVVPVALGGTDEPSNLATACDPCNTGKAASAPDAPLIEDIDVRAAMWRNAMAIVAQQRAAEREEHDRIAEYLWTHWNAQRPNMWRSTDLPDDWENSIRTFVAAGLDVQDLAELMCVALSTTTASDKFRYFCGCCWTRIRQAQEAAAQIVTVWEAQDRGE